jgi:hypothetical protein
MRLADALRAAVQKNPAPLEHLKRNPATRATALRLEEHAYGRASNVKTPKKGR